MGIDLIQNDYFVNPFMGVNNYNLSVPATASSSLFGFGFNNFPIFSSYTAPVMTSFNFMPTFFNFFNGFGSSLKSAGHNIKSGIQSVYRRAKLSVGSRFISGKAKSLLNNDAFMNKVINISNRLGCDFKDLLGVMKAESGLNPEAVNKKSNATGLIQFMPKTAQSLGTSIQALRNMSAVQQLEYVEKFLLNAKRRAGFKDGERLSAGQLYALVFLPARAKREVLTTSNEAYYRYNSATDLNGDGKITRSEMDARAKRFNVDKFIPQQYLA